MARHQLVDSPRPPQWPALAGYYLCLLCIPSAQAAPPTGAQLYRWRPAADELRPLTTNPAADYRSPASSRDGQWIAYSKRNSSDNNPTTHICVARADGSDERELAVGLSPTWSSDDQYIAFARHNPQPATAHSPATQGPAIQPPTADVYLMQREGRNVSLLSRSADSPRWSPVAPHVALIDADRRNLAVLNIITMERRQCLPEGWLPDGGISWSPDGQQLCYRLPGYRDEPSSLIIVPANAPTPRVRLQADLGDSTTWSHDGKTILVSLRTNRSSPFQLMLVQVNSQAPPTLVPGQPRDRNNEGADWSPDGQLVIFSSRPFPD